MTLSQIKLISLAGIGGMLEFFDFVIYALFAGYISQAFFPNANPAASLVQTYAVFAIGYVGRPLGSLIFGHLGDRYGRKHAFTIAAFIMAFSTFLIGCLPTYQQIGMPAAVLLTLLRIMQGISLGGEIGGTTVFVTEHVPFKKRGLVIGLIFMTISFGNVFGSLLAYLLTHFFPEKFMFAWGWRIPFWIGFGLGIVAYLIRKKTLETPEFSALQDNQKSRFPFATLLRQAFPSLLISISLTAASAATFSLLMYLPSYMTMILHYPVSHSFLYNVVGFLIVSVFSAVFGFISDYAGRKQMLLLGASLMMILSYDLFQQLISSNNLLFFNIGLAFLAAITNGCYACAIAEQFETKIRYTGMAFAFNVGTALFAGVTPFASTALFKLTHQLAAPIYFLMICSGITLLGALAIKRHARYAGDDQGYSAHQDQDRLRLVREEN